MSASQIQSGSDDLHGNVPDRSELALVLIDVINDLEFERGEALLAHALPMAQRIAELKQRLKIAGVPAIYVNDNFGKWQSNFNNIVRHCLDDNVRGKPIVELLEPDDDDYFVLKPKHSGFFSTTLDLLLRYLGVHTLILVGVQGNNCVLFTANDAYMRDFKILVPSDCVASEETADNEYALQQMQQVLKADIRPANEINLEEIRGIARRDKEEQRGSDGKQDHQQKAATESRYSG
jgi:nicotinamidase-related amidase